MLYLLFRAADHEVEFSAEAAVYKIARRLTYSIWLPSVFVQPITGFALVRLKPGLFAGDYPFDRWLQVSLILYVASLLFWLLGLGSIRVEFGEKCPRIRPSTVKLRGQRDVCLKVALSLNILTFSLMVYSNQWPAITSKVETLMKSISQ